MPRTPRLPLRPVWAALLLAPSLSAAPDELVDRRDRLEAADRNRLGSIIGGVRAGPDNPHATALLGDLRPVTVEGGGRLFVPLPELDRPGDGRPGDPVLLASAADWFGLAGESLQAGRYALADACLRRAIARDPNHADARRLLGYLPYDGGWATPFALNKLRTGNVLHPQFGWVPADWAPRLDAGQLPAPGEGAIRWMEAGEADRLRQGDFSRAWTIRLPHFALRANVPLADGIQFGRRLEDFHQLFGSWFADVIGAERLPLAALARRPEARPTVDGGPVHRVNYFATKGEYVAYLSPRQGPDIDQTLGVYIPPPIARARREQEASYFFDDRGGPIESTATLYHEVSHQLLFERAGESRYERNNGQFWVFEGLGTYFETAAPQPDGSLVVGGRRGARYDDARRRALDRGEFLPTARFVGLSRRAFEADQEIRLHYAQAMALTLFLMEGEGGRHRAPFLQYVADVYRGRLREPAGRSLDDRLGLTYEEIDRRLIAYLGGP